MSFQDNSSAPKHLQAGDFKSLIQNQGKATIGENKFELQSPTHDDANLQTIVKDPAFTVKPMGSTPVKGETCSYELSAGQGGKSVKATVSCK